MLSVVDLRCFSAVEETDSTVSPAARAAMATSGRPAVAAEPAPEPAQQATPQPSGGLFF